MSYGFEVARSLATRSARSTRASQKTRIHEKAKENAKTVLSRLASFDNASNSTTGFMRSGVSVMSQKLRLACALRGSRLKERTAILTCGGRPQTQETVADECGPKHPSILRHSYLARCGCMFSAWWKSRELISNQNPEKSLSDPVPGVTRRHEEMPLLGLGCVFARVWAALFVSTSNPNNGRLLKLKFFSGSSG